MLKKLLPLTKGLGIAICMQLGLQMASAQDCTFDKQPRENHKHVNETIYNFLNNQESNKSIRIANTCATNNDTLKIPVVVHLIYGTNTKLKTKANLTDSIVKGLIGDWNLRFSKYSGRTYTNPYSGVETKIRFVLATRDPQGVVTNGILHHNDDFLAKSVTQENDSLMKKKYAWNTSQYYNFYVVDTFATGGLAGYATFPAAHGTIADGAVFQGSYVWKGFYYNTGLMAHETGHYLGLYHPFEGNSCTNNNCLLDGDQVCDTPPKNVSGTTGTCNAPGNSCKSDTVDTNTRNPFRSKKLGGLGDQVDGNEFYMDYTGGCWGLNYPPTYIQSGAFSQGQLDRMRASLLTIRKSLLTSPALVPLNSKEISINNIVSPLKESCNQNTTIVFNVSNLGSSAISTFQYTITVNGVVGSTQTWTGNLLANQNINITSNVVNLTYGTNSVSIDVNLTGDTYLINNSICSEIALNQNITSNNFNTNFETNPITGWNSQNIDGLVGFTNYNLSTCNTKGSTVLGYLAQPTTVAGTGTNDYYVSDQIDLTNFTSANFSFDYAHKGYYSNRQLSLKIEVSTDCGLTYTSLWGFATSSGLSTIPSGSIYTSYQPTSCNDWKNISIPLTSYLNKQIKIRFNANVVSYGAQNLFIDNISLTGNKIPTAIEQNTDYQISVSPNPIENNFVINCKSNGKLQIEISNITGNMLFAGEVNANQELSNLSNAPKGIYFIKVISGNKTEVIKILK